MSSVRASCKRILYGIVSKSNERVRGNLNSDHTVVSDSLCFLCLQNLSAPWFLARIFVFAVIR